MAPVTSSTPSPRARPHRRGRRGPTTVATLVVAVLAGVACSPTSQPPQSSVAAAGTTAPSSTPTTALSSTRAVTADVRPVQTVPPTPPAATTAVPDGRVTLAFAGDVHFAGRLEPLLADPSAALASLAPVLAVADVSVLNLESAITERGSKEPKKFHFRAPATSLDAIAATGVDVIALANNHTVDYGGDGLSDTLAARTRSPVPVIGVGVDDADAFAPAVIDVRGTSVAVLSATQVPDHTVAAWPAGPGSPGVAAALDPDRLVQAVERARHANDLVVVYLHWGTERQGCPDAGQLDLTPRLVAAGADVVVGTHAHRLLGSGWWSGEEGSAYVSYGLGNFVWWLSNGENAVTTGVLTLTMDGRRATSHRWTPMRIGDDGVPAVVPAAARAGALNDWQALLECTDLAAAPPPS